MLEGLDDISWSSLRHAHGEASDVPRLIRALVSADQPWRERALRDLFGNIWHQGTVYEATVHALPFLIDLLRHPATPDKDGVAMLVASIACGNGYYLVHSAVGITPAAGLQASFAKEREVVAAIRSLSASALDLLKPYLAHREPELRGAIAEAFACFPSRADDLLPLLRTALERERNEDARAAIGSAIESLGSSPGMRDRKGPTR